MSDLPSERGLNLATLDTIDLCDYKDTFLHISRASHGVSSTFAFTGYPNTRFSFCKRYPIRSLCVVSIDWPLCATAISPVMSVYVVLLLHLPLLFNSCRLVFVHIKRFSNFIQTIVNEELK